MIKLENTEVVGLDAAIRGMRNPMNSWEKCDSAYCHNLSDFTDKNWDYNCAGCENEVQFSDCTIIGPNDHKLMMSLAKGGPVHAKYRRMIAVYVDITAPLYWWKEFDTYKVGTVANSCSTMHKIHETEFTLEDFSRDHIDGEMVCTKCGEETFSSWDVLKLTINALNYYRENFLKTKDKKYWWQMIQLLPSSYNQRRTIMLNYEVLAGIYPMRKDHKLDEWHEFCQWIESLPYSEVITLEEK